MEVPKDPRRHSLQKLWSLKASAIPLEALKAGASFQNVPSSTEPIGRRLFFFFLKSRHGVDSMPATDAQESDPPLVNWAHVSFAELPEALPKQSTEYELGT